MTGLTAWRFWAWPSELRRGGVLGINDRNITFLLDSNSRKLYPRVDDKSITKRICEAQNIPVPETYAVIERFGDIHGFPDLIRGRQEFVVKPARGAAGRGVLVVLRHHNGKFHTSDGKVLSLAEVRYHLSSMLSGLYSLGGLPDRAILEQRIIPHPVFEKLAVGGTPDIRIIVYRGAPVMAMLRLPTRASGGRANLHQGGVGVGLDLATGITLGGVWKDRAVEIHPDTGRCIRGIGIPYWANALTAATRLSQAIGLEYVGIDVVLDANQGAVVLEANARPGLAIQIANRCGLRPLLEAIDLERKEWPAKGLTWSPEDSGAGLCARRPP